MAQVWMRPWACWKRSRSASPSRPSTASARPTSSGRLTRAASGTTSSPIRASSSRPPPDNYEALKKFKNSYNIEAAPSIWREKSNFISCILLKNVMYNKYHIVAKKKKLPIESNCVQFVIQNKNESISKTIELIFIQ